MPTPSTVQAITRPAMLCSGVLIRRVGVPGNASATGRLAACPGRADAARIGSGRAPGPKSGRNNRPPFQRVDERQRIAGGLRGTGRGIQGRGISRVAHQRDAAHRHPAHRQVLDGLQNRRARRRHERTVSGKQVPCGRLSADVEILSLIARLRAPPTPASPEDGIRDDRRRRRHVFKGNHPVPASRGGQSSAFDPRASVMGDAD